MKRLSVKGPSVKGLSEVSEVSEATRIDRTRQRARRTRKVTTVNRLTISLLERHLLNVARHAIRAEQAYSSHNNCATIIAIEQNNDALLSPVRGAAQWLPYKRDARRY